MCGAGPGDLGEPRGSLSAKNTGKTDPNVSSQTAFRCPGTSCGNYVRGGPRRSRGAAGVTFGQKTQGKPTQVPRGLLWKLMCGAGPCDLGEPRGSVSAKNTGKTDPSVSSQTAFRCPGASCGNYVRGGPRRSRGAAGVTFGQKTQGKPTRTFPARLPSGAQGPLVEIDVRGGPRRSRGAPGSHN